MFLHHPVSTAAQRLGLKYVGLASQIERVDDATRSPIGAKTFRRDRDELHLQIRRILFAPPRAHLVHLNHTSDILDPRGLPAERVEGHYRSQHSRDGGATTERTTGRILWAEKRTKNRFAT